MTMVVQGGKRSNGARFDGFGERIKEVADTAAYLYACKVEGNFSSFNDACITAGLTHEIGGVSASVFYWERIDLASKSSRPITEVTDNSQLAASLGILLKNDDTPRNRLLYDLFQVIVNDVFRADIVDGPHVGGCAARRASLVRSVTMHDVRQGDAWKIPVFELFKGKQPSDFVDSRIAAKAQPLVDALGADIGMRMGSLLFHQRMVLPDAFTSGLVAQVLRRGMDGQEIVVAGAFCPDYAYEPSGDPNLPYRYTFEGLGEGIGLVARQFARVIPPLSKLFTELGVRHRIVLGIGDFEADSQAVLQRVKCDYAEFVRRCSASLDAFRAAVGSDLPLTLELCDGDRCRGRLRRYAAEATERMSNGDFGRMSEVFPSPEGVLNDIIRDNGAFYQRWYKGIAEDGIRRIVLAQGGEYAALSRIYAEDFGEGNVLIISGDRPMMHAFDNVYVVIPTLCVKRTY